MSYKELFYLGKSFADHELYDLTKQAHYDNMSYMSSLTKLISSRLNYQSQIFEEENRNSLQNIELFTSEIKFTKFSNILQDGFTDISEQISINTDRLIGSINYAINYISSDLENINNSIKRQTEYVKSILAILSKSFEHKSFEKFNAGIRWFEVRQYDLAKQDFEAALSLDNTNTAAFLYLGIIYVEKNVPDMAYENFVKAYIISNNKEDKARACFFLGRHYYVLNKFDEALKYLEEATVLQPEISEYWYSRSLYSYLSTTEQKDSEKVNQSLKFLEEAIIRNWGFWRTCLVERGFTQIREQILETLNTLRTVKINEANCLKTVFEKVIEAFKNLECVNDYNSAIEVLNKYEEMLGQKNIFLILKVIEEIQIEIYEGYLKVESKTEKIVSNYTTQINTINIKLQKELEDTKYLKSKNEPRTGLEQRHGIFVVMLWICFFIIFVVPISFISSLFQELAICIFPTMILIVPTIFTILGYFYNKQRLKNKERKKDRYILELEDWYNKACSEIRGKYNYEINIVRTNKSKYEDYLAELQNSIRNIKLTNISNPLLTLLKR